PIVTLMAITPIMPRGNTLPDWVPLAITGGVVVGAFTMAAARLYGYSTIRCPCCGGELGSLTYHRIFSIAHVKFCLHCGKSLDDELPTVRKSGKSTSKPTPREDELA